MNIKIENWNGNDIRFVEKNSGDWWAVANDVANALGYSNPRDAIAKHCEGVAKYDIPTNSGVQEFNIISEEDIYELVFSAAKQSKSRVVKEKARSFKHWVFDILKTLRQASGLEGFQIFLMLDKEHQKQAMDRLQKGLYQPKQKDFIKANTVANKAISTLRGYPKMIKKDDMAPDMLVERQRILDDTVNLMTVNESFNLGLSVSDTVYKKYGIKGA